MSQKKTEFRFQVHADATLIDGVIRSWLMANQFSFVAKPGANYYAFNEPMLRGKRGFEYYINGSDVIILAYLGTYEKPKALEGFVAAVMKQEYRNSMAPLFEELKKLDNAGAANMAADTCNTAQPGGNVSPYGSYNAAPNTNAMPGNSLNTFMEQNTKKQETMVIIGFIMSLVGILLSCLGATYGVLLIILEYYFAIQGLKTKKKGLAIATIVLASVSIVLFLVSLVIYVLLA